MRKEERKDGILKYYNKIRWRNIRFYIVERGIKRSRVEEAAEHPRFARIFCRLE